VRGNPLGTRLIAICCASPFSRAGSIAFPPNDLMGLAIVDGTEDGLSTHEATGLGIWAAGSAGRLTALADAVLSYVECVTVFRHDDPAGRRGATELAMRLRALGFETSLKIPACGGRQWPRLTPTRSDETSVRTASEGSWTRLRRRSRRPCPRT
jgi:hypothetical protein